MIPVKEAQKLILENSFPLGTHEKTLIHATGYVLAEDIFSPVDLPPFDNSAMDGYAFRYGDLADGKDFSIIGESAAGSNSTLQIGKHEASRIFTGAKIPQGTDTVVMQEKTSYKDAMVTIRDEQITAGANIRRTASQTKKGDLALAKGTKLIPAAIGYLASMGISKVIVSTKPSVSIIITGDELQEAGEILKPGHIYESNSAALVSALKQMGIEALYILKVPDIEEKIIDVLKKVMQSSDLVILTGGISVGDYDFAGKALEKLGIQTVFYKVKQKPGKPIFFGTNQEKLFFALPGNPASVISCFYNFVLPALNNMEGAAQVFLNKVRLPLTNDCPKKPGLTHFLKARITRDGVMVLEGQESYKMNSFALADALICLPEEQGGLKSGDMVDVIMLP
jgi:molybdopterin molybdotransferase